MSAPHSLAANAVSAPLTPDLHGTMALLSAPRSRYTLLQSLVGIALSYQLLFGTDLVVARWVAECAVGGLLATILVMVLIPSSVFGTSWFLNALVATDTVLTAGTAYASGNAQEEFYLAYFLLILIAGSARSLNQMLGLTAIVACGYGVLLTENAITGVRDLVAGRIMGLPVLMTMGVFYGLTLEELGRERRRGDGLSHRLAELRVEEQRLLMNRDRLLHETTTLRQALAASSPGGVSARAAAVQALAEEVVGRTSDVSTASVATGVTPQRPVAQAVGRASGPSVARMAEDRAAFDRFTSQVATMLDDVACSLGRETGLLRTQLKRDDPSAAQVDQLLLAGERVGTIAAQLRAQQTTARVEATCRLSDVLTQIEPAVRALLPESIQLTVTPSAPTPPIAASAEDVERLLLQAALQAREAMGGAGHLTLSLEVRATEVGLPSTVHCLVQDSAVERDAAKRVGLLDAGLTAQSSAGSWGAGLSTVESAARALGARVTVAALASRGTEVRIVWSQAVAVGKAQAADGASSIPTALRSSGGETVLLVEDDDLCRAWTAAQLRRAQYRVIEARSGVEALLHAQDHGGRPALLLTNLIMPEMSGAELAERLLATVGMLRAVFVSHVPEEAVTTHRIAGRFYLAKPYRQEALLRKVREVLDGR
ncbi:MAG: response regulator [Nitrospiraceae bacterium]